MFSSQETDKGKVGFPGNFYRQIRWCCTADEYRHLGTYCLNRYLRGEPSTEEKDLVLERYVFKKGITDNLVNGIMPPDVLCKNEDLIFTAERCTVNTAGVFKEF
jgi:hypothetical protein